MTSNEAKVAIVQILLLPLYARVFLGTVAYELVTRGYAGYERTRDLFRAWMYKKT